MLLTNIPCPGYNNGGVRRLFNMVTMDPRTTGSVALHPSSISLTHSPGIRDAAGDPAPISGRAEL